MRGYAKIRLYNMDFEMPENTYMSSAREAYAFI